MLLARQISREQRRVEALKRFLARQNGQELILINAVATFGRGGLCHANACLIPATYRQRPQIPPQILHCWGAPLTTHQRRRGLRTGGRRPRGAPMCHPFWQAARFPRCRHWRRSCAPAAALLSAAAAARTAGRVLEAPMPTNRQTLDPAHPAAQ